VHKSVYDEFAIKNINGRHQLDLLTAFGTKRNTAVRSHLISQDKIIQYKTGVYKSLERKIKNHFKIWKEKKERVKTR